MPIRDVYQVAAVMMSMLREHLVFTDLVGYRYTTKKQEGYLSYTEIFIAKHPGYGCGIH
jgi:hypothetical protein